MAKSTRIDPTKAYPLMRYKIGPAPGNPSVAVVRFDFQSGFVNVAMTRQILLELASAFSEVAGKMPENQ